MAKKVHVSHQHFGSSDRLWNTGARFDSSDVFMKAAKKLDVSDEETDCLRRALNGDRQAWDEAIQRYGSDIVSRLRGRIPLQEIPDCLQEAFLRCFVNSLRGSHIKPYEESVKPGLFIDFVVRAARWRFVDLRRKQINIESKNLPYYVKEKSPEQEIFVKHILDRLNSALPGLTEEEQRICLLRFKEELLHAEIAEQVRRKHQTIRKRCPEIIAKLAALAGLKRDEDE